MEFKREIGVGGWLLVIIWIYGNKGDDLRSVCGKKRGVNDVILVLGDR